MITSNVAFYACIDIDETDKFYSEIIGLEKVMHTGDVRIFSTVKGHFGFIQRPDRKALEGRVCLSLNCGSQAEVRLEYDRIVKLGGVPLDEPQQYYDQPVYSFFIKDPNGYLVEFQKINDLDL